MMVWPAQFLNTKGGDLVKNIFEKIFDIIFRTVKVKKKVVHSARYITFKLCSSCPYKEEFYDTLSAIGKLNVQLE